MARIILKTALSDTHRLLANLPGNQHITRRNALLVPTFAVAQAAHVALIPPTVHPAYP
jgi:hypothetical protein